MTYYSPKKLIPSTIVVNIDGIDYPMKDPSAWRQDPNVEGLGIGTPDKGLYIYKEDISGRISPAFQERCRAYYFQVNNTDGTFRLPESGYYGTCDYLLRDLRTTGVNLYANYPPSCADNWVDTSPPPIKQIPSFPQLPDKVDGSLYSIRLGQSGPWGNIALHPGGDSALAVQLSPSGTGRENTLHYFESLSNEIFNSYFFSRTKKAITADLLGDRLLGHYAEWAGVTSSADGSKLFAIQSAAYSLKGETPRLYHKGYIYVSQDFGKMVIRVKNVTGDWSGVASSVDGSVVVAVERGDTTSPNPVGSIWTSFDFGHSWSKQVRSNVRRKKIGRRRTSD